MLKVKLNGYLKEKERITFDTFGIKEKNKIIMNINNDLLKLEIKENSIFLEKKNSDSKLNIIFNTTKTNAKYVLNNFLLPLNIKTNKIDINNEYILIKYTNLDSYENFEFYLKWEDIK